MPAQEIKDAIATAKKLKDSLPFIPVTDSIIIYRLKVTSTAGGIMLPDDTGPSSRGHAVSAVVLSVGGGKYEYGHHIPMNVKEDDYILISSIAGLELGEVIRKEIGPDVSFEEIRLIRMSDVIAKLKSDFLDNAA